MKSLSQQFGGSIHSYVRNEFPPSLVVLPIICDDYLLASRIPSLAKFKQLGNLALLDSFLNDEFNLHMVETYFDHFYRPHAWILFPFHDLLSFSCILIEVLTSLCAFIQNILDITFRFENNDTNRMEIKERIKKCT